MDEKPSTIDAYISTFPPETQEKLQEMRELVRRNAPEATERITWAMPTFFHHGNVVHFAAAKSHIGLYPGADGVSCFEDKLQGYTHSKGAIQFPMGEPLPHDLIEEIVRFRYAQNEAAALAKAQAKAAKKKKPTE